MTVTVSSAVPDGPSTLVGHHPMGVSTGVFGELRGAWQEQRCEPLLADDRGRLREQDRARKGEGWGLRNAKLRLSRKALFAGGLLPVLECYRYAAGDMLEYLDERMSAAPLDRIADAFVDHQALDAGVRALTAYDAFLAILDDGEQRRELKELGLDGARDSPVFTRVAELGEEFEAGLLSLLFDDPELRRWVREYIVF